MSTAPFVHPTAIVDSGAQLGVGTKVWHWTHICAGATIGARCVLGQNVYVAGSASLADNVHVQNNVSVYDGVTLESDVFCGPSMVFTNVAQPRARYPHSPSQYQATRVKIGASLGANCTVRGGVTIGCYALIGAGSVVLQDVPDFALVVGVPARQTGWVSQRGENLALPLSGSATAQCPVGGETYELSGEQLLCTADGEAPASF